MRLCTTKSGLRIDYCEACRAYLKTYNGHGDESVLLADWTSVHLDLAAQQRGWRRAGTSLYEVGANEGSAPAMVNRATRVPPCEE